MLNVGSLMLWCRRSSQDTLGFECGVEWRGSLKWEWTLSMGFSKWR